MVRFPSFVIKVCPFKFSPVVFVVSNNRRNRIIQNIIGDNYNISKVLSKYTKPFVKINYYDTQLFWSKEYLYITHTLLPVFVQIV